MPFDVLLNNSTCFFMKYVLVAFTVFTLGFLNLQAAVPDSTRYPQNYFKTPLDLPVLLAGNFGEPRRSHFHTGLDIQTNSEEGHKVLAAAEGYISRINVSAVGYGNALYITHPNGYVSVYGHLQQFNAAITEKVRRVQYANHSFEVDFNPAPGDFPVKQGDLIALSGNSGGSGGPHLHFEIRDTNEIPYNPLLFGIKMIDNLKPIVNAVKFYPLDSLKYDCPGYRLKTELKGAEYKLPSELVKLNAGLVGFSVNAFDVMDGSENHIGIYSISVTDNGKLVYQFKMNQVPFFYKRYVASHLDYAIFINESNHEFHKCFLDPGNRLPVYSHVVNRGMINLADGNEHKVEVQVNDFSGNTSTIKFTLAYDSSSTAFKRVTNKYSTVLYYGKENSYSTDDLKLSFPKNCLFDTIHLRCTAALATDPKIYSKIHQVGNSDEQAFDWFDISVRAERLAEGLRSKAVLMYKDNNGETAFRGGVFDNGFIKTRGRDFGQYYIVVDSTAPAIRPLNVSPMKNMQAAKKIELKITDDISGIETYSGYMDGKWVLTSYDAKNALFTCDIDAALPHGEHVYRIVVADERKNKADYSVKFKW